MQVYDDFSIARQKSKCRQAEGLASTPAILGVAGALKQQGEQ
jgi:hypothetical protein